MNPKALMANCEFTLAPMNRTPCRPAGRAVYHESAAPFWKTRDPSITR
jgi:hypothetical protein